MFQLVLVVSIFALFGHSNCAPYKVCEGTAEGKVASVDIPNCSPQICPLKKGTNVTIDVSFQSSETAKKLTTVVHGIIAGVKVPFNVPHEDNSCENFGVTCPLQPGKNYKYSAVIPVSTSYPKIRLVVQWELKDENSKDVFCIKIPVQIVDADKKEENSVLKFRSFN